MLAISVIMLKVCACTVMPRMCCWAQGNKMVEYGKCCELFDYDICKEHQLKQADKSDLVQKHLKRVHN